MIKKLLSFIRMTISRRRAAKKLISEGTLLHAFKEKKIIFIHIPKTAGVSLIKSIYGDVSLEGHRYISFYKMLFGVEYADYMTFSFVRNPWDRLYSAYKFLEKGGMNIHDRRAFEMYLSRYKDFEDFVMNGLSRELIYEIIHFIPQSDFICDDNDILLVDFLGIFEKLDDSVSDLGEIIGMDISIEHYNLNKKRNYTDVYTEKMIQRVYDIYKRDIDIFGYNFR